MRFHPEMIAVAPLAQSRLNEGFVHANPFGALSFALRGPASFGTQARFRTIHDNLAELAKKSMVSGRQGW